ncbi:MAG: hypothetical protein QNJ85_16755 [Gammaproteobacteria bacterium]|nr:hypothetical protein [Gammaproteobacteria bacterium]
MRSWLLVLLFCCSGIATAGESSGFGQIAIPSPVKPTTADSCVEPVEVMRREHMHFLLHQRDETVIDGDRGSRHSLTGCMDCHNPATAEPVVRYEDPEHFCAECHAYTGVKIDCFECHADRGLEQTGQSRRDDQPAWRAERNRLTAMSLQQRLEHSRGE